MIDVRLARVEDSTPLSDFYAAWDYHAPFSRAAATHLAWDSGSLVGAVWVDQADGLSVLRGMRVRLDRQRQGIGTQLLRAALNGLPGQPVYCIALAHLRPLLERAAFTLLPEGEQPPALSARAAGYHAGGREVVVMLRLPEGKPGRVAV
jgi:GNAT superfamily N-acetyltransferase